MAEKKFTFRQKWMPGFSDADGLREERCHRTKKDFNSFDFPFRDFFGRWTRSLVLAGALLWTGYQAIGNNIQYSKGQRVGVVNKISEKGLFWKTKEGQLSLEGRTSTGDYTGAGVWNFSMPFESQKRRIYDEIEKYMEKGQRVKITYEQPLATWPWRADTTYLVRDVEALKNK